MTRLYALIATLFGLAVDLFYRRRHLGGAVPTDGPVVLVGNHPNGLIDPIVVMRVAGRPVRFLAKEPLFRTPVIGWLLKQVGALPVYRARDGHDTGANLGMFTAVHGALGAGECICLFPEGTSHSDPQLKPLKTGAARMALGAAAEHDFGLDLRIVPIGLTFPDKARFRSEAAVQIGEPVAVQTFRALYLGDEREGVRALTAAIDDAIRGVTVNLDRWEDLPLAELAGRVWAGDDEVDPVETMRTVADAQRSFLERDPEKLAELRHRLERFHATLQALEIPPEALDREYRPASVRRFVLRNTLALLGLPIAALGVLAWCAPYYAVRALANRFADEVDVVATVKLLAGMVCYPVWYAALLVGLAVGVAGWAAALGAVLLPLAGVYSQLFREQIRDAWREVGLFAKLVDRRALHRALRAERAALRAEIEAAWASLE